MKTKTPVTMACVDAHGNACHHRWSPESARVRFEAGYRPIRRCSHSRSRCRVMAMPGQAAVCAAFTPRRTTKPSWWSWETSLLATVPLNRPSGLARCAPKDRPSFHTAAPQSEALLDATFHTNGLRVTPLPLSRPTPIRAHRRRDRIFSDGSLARSAKLSNFRTRLRKTSHRAIGYGPSSHRGLLGVAAFGADGPDLTLACDWRHIRIAGYT